MKRDFCYYLFLFLSMAILGWFGELLFMLFVNHRVVNGGFLLGPWTPIYGWGCLMIALIFKKEKSDNLIVLIKSIFYCSLLEYLTSFILEILFCKKWWDYSNYFLNLNGRICLFNSLLWGILGLFYIRKIEPYVYKLYTGLNSNFIKKSLFLVSFLYIIDSIYSIIVRMP